MAGLEENWLNEWSFRKSHIIEAATGADINYPIAINVHYGSGSDGTEDMGSYIAGKVYCSSHCKSDFGDIRFTDDDGETLLDYWMEMIEDSVQANFWIEIADNLTSTNQLIYIYYGNSGVSTTSNEQNTFVSGYADDYEPSNSFVNQLNAASTEASISTEQVVSPINSVKCPAGTYQYDFGTSVAKTLPALSRIRIINWYYSAEATPTAIDHIFAFFTGSYSSPTWKGPHVGIFTDGKLKHYSGSWKDSGWAIAANTWYRFEIDINFTTSKFDVHVNGTLRIDQGSFFASMASNANVFLSAGNNWGTTTLHYYDNYFFRKYISPEPAHGDWGEEEGGEDIYYINYSNISQNSTMLGTYATFSVLWNSNGSLIDYTFEWNYTGSMVADSPIEWDNYTSPQWSNITKDLGTNVTLWHYVIQWRINATAQGDTLNNTEIQNFITTAIVVTYHVPDTGILKINSTETSTSIATTFYSTISDGEISFGDFNYNTVYESDVGGVIDYEETFRIGQAYVSFPFVIYSINRAFLFFDTSSFPDKVITSATLCLYGSNDASNTDFYITIQNGLPIYPHDPLQEGDYAKGNYTGNGGQFNTSEFQIGTYNNITFNSEGINWINKTGITKLCVRSATEITGTAPIGNEFIEVNSYEAGENYKPLLVITYASPNSTEKYPYSLLVAESLPSTGYSFFNFTENTIYYNSNPSTITFPITNFMVDYISDFTMILGIGGNLEEWIALAFIACIITGVVVSSIFISSKKK